MFRKLIDYFGERSVLLLGFGREGRSTYAFIRKYYPQKPLGIADKNAVDIEDDHVRLFTGEGYLDAMEQYDLVMQSPGVSLRDVNIPDGVEVSGQIDLFLRFVDCETIGVTGTKGKSTTSTLIYEILRAAEKSACLIGNIGTPVFESLTDIQGKTAVIEMSSHQLEFAKASPHIAVFTNIYEEHLDHYKGFKGYVDAKLNVLRHQHKNDYFVYNADQSLGDFIDFKNLAATGIAVSADDGEKDTFLHSLTKLNIRLPGRHNHHDIYFAAAVAKILGIKKDALARGIQNFSGIEHRMEPMGVFHGIRFYNDCIATVPESVIFAVQALKDVDSLIIGGMDRGIDYTRFVAELRESGIDHLICMPETGHDIGAKLAALGSKINIVLVDDMEQAVQNAFALTAVGKSCLLSPAAPSYNRYKSFEEKGRQFKKLVSAWAE